jgi:hypothetical protein
MLAWCGRASFGDHCFNFAKAIADSADGGVIEEMRALGFRRED